MGLVAYTITLAEIGRIVVQGQPKQNVRTPYLQNNQSKTLRFC
jgi:hypothetical protein